MTIADRPANPLEAAIASPTPSASLRAAVRQMVERGFSRPEVLEALEELRDEVRRGPRPDDEDVVLDVMDAVAGWAPAHIRI
jgi:hypothetical protein